MLECISLRRTTEMWQRNKKSALNHTRTMETLLFERHWHKKTWMAIKPFRADRILSRKKTDKCKFLHILQQKQHYEVLGVKDVIVIRKLTTKVCDPPLVGSLLKVTKCNKILLSPASVQSLVEYQSLFSSSCPPPHRGWAVLRRAGHMFTKDPES